MTDRIYVTDCEGPLTRNDNAQEIAERFIPDGAEFFARLSKYDDFLVDVAGAAVGLAVLSAVARGRRSRSRPG